LCLLINNIEKRQAYSMRAAQLCQESPAAQVMMGAWGEALLILVRCNIVAAHQNTRPADVLDRSRMIESA
jgi:hypothetical protein